MRRLLALLLLLLPAAPSPADDHDSAREALARKEILPLSQILAVVEREVAGRVIKIDFDRDNGRYVYEIEVLSRDGRLVEFSIDAATGAVLEREDGDR
jgi:uncharacterized membrane protein YkoI